MNSTMKATLRHSLLAAALVGALALGTPVAHAADPLPSWNNGPARQAIVDFVRATTAKGSPKFVPPAERIATFDNDGTLWCEQPMYFQCLFALDRVKALAPQHPEWKEKEPFASLLKSDPKEALAGGVSTLLGILTGLSARTLGGEPKGGSRAQDGAGVGICWGGSSIPCCCSLKAALLCG